MAEGFGFDILVDDYDWLTVSVAEADRGWFRAPTHVAKDVGGHLDPVFGFDVGPCRLHQSGDDVVHVLRSALRGLGDLRDERA